MNYTYFTVIISAAKFPNAEICVTFLRYYYPKIKILLAFDFSKQYSEIRREFFVKRKINVIPNIFNDAPSSSSHGKQLDRLSAHVQTPYFITMDDDAFIKKEGLIEKTIDIIKNSNASHIGAVNGTRFHPLFSVVDTVLFKKNKLSFLPFMKGKNFYDTGSEILLFCQNNNIKTYAINNFIHNYVDHLGQMHRRINDLMIFCVEDFSFSQIKLEKDLDYYSAYLLRARKALDKSYHNFHKFNKNQDVVFKDFGFIKI